MNRFYDQEDRDLFLIKKLNIDPVISASGNGSESIRLKLKRVSEDDYIGLNIDYMIWFYTYYMKAENNRNVIVSDDDSKVIEEHDGLEYQLYPIYRTSFNYDDFASDNESGNEIENSNLNESKQTDYGVQSIIDKYIDQNYSDFTESEHSDSTDSEN